MKVYRVEKTEFSGERACLRFSVADLGFRTKAKI